MSYKNEFTEVYNYLSDLCKDPIFTMSEASENDFDWKDDDVFTGVIIKYKGSVSKVKVPEDVVEIGCRDDDGLYDPVGKFGCFEDCKYITDVILPKSLKIIGEGAFYKCINLVFINIPYSVTSIGPYAFSYCESLESITIPDGVTSIGPYAFAYCESLKSINISDGVTSIGGNAFSDCPNLKEIFYSGSIALEANRDWYGIYADCKIIRR